MKNLTFLFAETGAISKKSLFENNKIFLEDIYTLKENCLIAFFSIINITYNQTLTFLAYKTQKINHYIKFSSKFISRSLNNINLRKTYEKQKLKLQDYFEDFFKEIIQVLS